MGFNSITTSWTAARTMSICTVYFLSRTSFLHACRTLTGVSLWLCLSYRAAACDWTFVPHAMNRLVYCESASITDMWSPLLAYGHTYVVTEALAMATRLWSQGSWPHLCGLISPSHIFKGLARMVHGERSGPGDFGLPGLLTGSRQIPTAMDNSGPDRTGPACWTTTGASLRSMPHAPGRSRAERHTATIRRGGKRPGGARIKSCTHTLSDNPALSTAKGCVR